MPKNIPVPNISGIDEMRDSAFLPYWFAYTEANVELRSFKNERGAGKSRPLFTRNMDLANNHCGRWDTPGRGMFFGCCTRELGATRGRRQDLVECPGLWLDIDCEKDDIDEQEAIRALQTCAHPPNIIIKSGAGIHAYWRFTEPIFVRTDDIEAERDIVRALKQLASIFAGDPKVCELARVLRLPGTMNSKYEGEPRPCVINEHLPGDHEFQDIREWLNFQVPLLTSKTTIEQGDGATGDQTPPPSDPYRAVAERQGWKPALDIEQMRADMKIGNIHET